MEASALLPCFLSFLHLHYTATSTKWNPMYHNKPTHPWWNSPLTAVLTWRFVLARARAQCMQHMPGSKQINSHQNTLGHSWSVRCADRSNTTRHTQIPISKLLQHLLVWRRHSGARQPALLAHCPHSWSKRLVSPATNDYNHHIQHGSRNGKIAVPAVPKLSPDGERGRPTKQNIPRQGHLAPDTQGPLRTAGLLRAHWGQHDNAPQAFQPYGSHSSRPPRPQPWRRSAHIEPRLCVCYIQSHDDLSAARWRADELWQC